MERLFDEWHQTWVPGRSASLADARLDLAAMFLVVLALLFVGARS